jgi:uncharacterized protein YdeI (YjbR/CyaY-like superfamily)
VKRARSVDEYIAQHPRWEPALRKLRGVLTTTPGLEETVKWGGPCYTVGGANVVGLGAFREHVALWFFQGVFLSDPDGVLVNAQEGKTKALRQWRFARTGDIAVTAVRRYVREAIANQKAGMRRAPARATALDVPAELSAGLAKHPKAGEAFAALTPGRQREYADYVATAVRAATRASRVARVVPMIEAGVGLNDRYRGS